MSPIRLPLNDDPLGGPDPCHASIFLTDLSATGKSPVGFTITYPSNLILEVVSFTSPIDVDEDSITVKPPVSLEYILIVGDE
jgi:hypothetical protein